MTQRCKQADMWMARSAALVWPKTQGQSALHVSGVVDGSVAVGSCNIIVSRARASNASGAAPSRVRDHGAVRCNHSASICNERFAVLRRHRLLTAKRALNCALGSRRKI